MGSCARKAIIGGSNSSLWLKIKLRRIKESSQSGGVLGNSLEADRSAGADAISRLLSSDAEEPVKKQALALVDTAPNDESRSETAATENPSPASHNTRGSATATPSYVVKFPSPETPIPRMTTLFALQEWEGYVTKVEENQFFARLVDLTAGMSHETSEAMIPMAEISGRDIENVEVGSIFRWAIGYENYPGGTRMRVSQIVFRDLPRVTARDVREGEKWATKVTQAFSDDP